MLHSFMVEMVSRRHPSTSSSGNRVRRRNSTTMASSSGLSTVLCGAVGPMGESAVVVLTSPHRVSRVKS